MHGRAYSTHEWKPFSNCTFLDHDTSEDLCHDFHNKTVLMVGDSLMTEMYHSLLYSLGVDPRFVMTSHDGSVKFPVRACNETVNVIIATEENPNMLNRSHRSMRDGHFAYLPAYLKEFRPDHVVMNRGAHFVPNETLWTEMDTSIQDLLSYATAYPETRLVYKTSPPGYPLSLQFREPVSNATIMLSYIHNRSLYPEYFHWYDFAGQNELVLDVLEKSPLSVEIMDGYDMLLGRPDRHFGVRKSEWIVFTIVILVLSTSLRACCIIFCT